MSTQDIGLMSALKQRMGWLNDRQKVVAQNVANASTPGFKPRDLKAQDFGALVAGATEGNDNLGMTQTNTMHMAVDGGGVKHGKEVVSPDSETTMDGNSVVLEEQMIKMSESRMQFQAAVSFYEKSMAMVRMAARAPGK
jgi:flagellar basal-body rod protein FlgB